MRPGVISIPPDATVSRVAATMLTRGIHAVVLRSSDPVAPLIVTDLELVRAALEQPDARAAQIAREPVAKLPADATLERAVRVMAERYVAHLLVTDPSSGEPAGIVSSFDIAAVLGGHEPRYARLLRPAPARPLISAASLAGARAGEVMHPGIATCNANESLAVVARMMAEHRVHCIAVAGIDGAAHLTWGLIGDLDLVVALDRGVQDEPAGSIAATESVAVDEAQTLDRVASLMVEHETSHVVVVSRAGLPAGIISTLDVAEILAGSGR